MELVIYIKKYVAKTTRGLVVEWRYLLHFKSSEEKRGVRYVKYLGNGDSSALNHVIEFRHYGNNISIYNVMGMYNSVWVRSFKD